MKARGHACALPGDHPSTLPRGGVNVRGCSSPMSRHFGPTNAPSFQAVQECAGFSRNASCKQSNLRGRTDFPGRGRAGGRDEDGGTACGHHAPRWLLQPKAAQCLPSNGCSLGHKLPSKKDSGGSSSLERPPTLTPQSSPQAHLRATAEARCTLRAGPEGQPVGRGVNSSHF